MSEEDNTAHKDPVPKKETVVEKIPLTKRFFSLWATIPAVHKKSIIFGIGLYFALLVITSIWVSVNSSETVNIWKNKILSANTVITSINGDVVISSPDFSDSKSAFSAGHKIAFIISHMGTDVEITSKTIHDLPKEVTLAFSPYSRTFVTLIDESLKKGHENIIMIPMESTNYPTEDAGAKSLSPKNSLADNIANLEWTLSRDEYLVGAMNFMGSFFLKDKIQTEAFFKAIESKNILFVQDAVEDETHINTALEGKNIKYIKADLKLDTAMSNDEFLDKIKELEEIAQKQGYAVVIVHPYPLSLDLINSWAKTAKERGFMLASLSSVWKNISHHGQ